MGTEETLPGLERLKVVLFFLDNNRVYGIPVIACRKRQSRAYKRYVFNEIQYVKMRDVSSLNILVKDYRRGWATF